MAGGSLLDQPQRQPRAAADLAVSASARSASVTGPVTIRVAPLVELDDLGQQLVAQPRAVAGGPVDAQRRVMRPAPRARSGTTAAGVGGHLAGKRRGAASDQPDRAVGVGAGAAPLDQPASCSSRPVPPLPVAHRPQRRRQSGQAVEARTAPPGALAGEVGDDPGWSAASGHSDGPGVQHDPGPQRYPDHAHRRPPTPGRSPPSARPPTSRGSRRSGRVRPAASCGRTSRRREPYSTSTHRAAGGSCR